MDFVALILADDMNDDAMDPVIVRCFAFKDEAIEHAMPLANAILERENARTPTRLCKIDVLDNSAIVIIEIDAQREHDDDEDEDIPSIRATFYATECDSY